MLPYQRLGGELHTNYSNNIASHSVDILYLVLSSGGFTTASSAHVQLLSKLLTLTIMYAEDTSLISFVLNFKD